MSESADDDLPSVMTCANYLKLPPYSTKVQKTVVLYTMASIITALLSIGTGFICIIREKVYLLNYFSLTGDYVQEATICNK